MPVYNSPSVTVRSEDTPHAQQFTEPTTSAATIIGPARRGPAFIPVRFSSFDHFESVFGSTDSERFGPLAVRAWIGEPGTTGTYIRTLGAGTCKKRESTGENAGRVDRAGFVVGDEQLSENNGFIAKNSQAGENGPLGKTYFLGCFMSESAGSTYFSDAGIIHGMDNLGYHAKSDPKNGSIPVLRGILMVPSGVSPSLTSDTVGNNEPSSVSFGKFDAAGSGDGGGAFGDINSVTGDKQRFIMILNGFTAIKDATGNVLPNGDGDLWNNAITASFDPLGDADVEYFGNVFNTDPLKIQKAGHYLHTHYPIDMIHAIATGSGIVGNFSIAEGDGEASVDGATVNVKYETAFLLTGSFRNSGSATSSTHVGTPNFEGFENRYTTAFSPFVTGHKVSGKRQDLFRIHTLDDGRAGSDALKITISNIYASNNEDFNPYGTFDLHVRRADQPDILFGAFSDAVESLETFANCNLDPSSPNYIAKKIGDTHTFFNFDSSLSQKIIVEGKYPSVSQYIRVEMDPSIDLGTTPTTLLPIGFRGLNHLITSGSTSNVAGYRSSILSGQLSRESGNAGERNPSTSLSDASSDIVARVIQPPVPMRENIKVINPLDTGPSSTGKVEGNLTWGVQYERKTQLDFPNESTVNSELLRGLVEYMPDYHTDYQNAWVGNNHGAPDLGGCVLDADRFNRNSFTLENIEVIENVDSYPDADEWSAAVYRRTGKAVGTMSNSDGVTKVSRLLDAKRDFTSVTENSTTVRYLKFTFPLQGGFDGVNIFNRDKSLFTDNAVRREYLDSAQGKGKGPTVSAYKKSLDILRDTTIPMSILALPGIRHVPLTEYATEMAENRFDTFYVMDIPLLDVSSTVITASYLYPSTPPTSSFDTEGTGVINPETTITNFSSNLYNSTFAAAYYPNIVITDTNVEAAFEAPPSVKVMGVLSGLSNSWSPPVGYTRGKVDADAVVISQTDIQIEKAFNAGINTIAPNIGGVPPFIRSEKTLSSNTANVFSRISVRRLLLEIRGTARRLARSTLFEGLNATTMKEYKNTLSAELDAIIARGGLTSYKIIMDTSNTTLLDSAGQAVGVIPGVKSVKRDRKFNIMRAKVLLKLQNTSDYVVLDIEEDG